METKIPNVSLLELEASVRGILVKIEKERQKRQIIAAIQMGASLIIGYAVALLGF